MDYGRKNDLETIYKAYKKAGSINEKQKYERLIHKLTNEDAYTKKMREQLIKAMRASDAKSVKRLSDMLHKHDHTRLGGQKF